MGRWQDRCVGLRYNGTVDCTPSFAPDARRWIEAAFERMDHGTART